MYPRDFSHEIFALVESGILFLHQLLHINHAHSVRIASDAAKANSKLFMARKDRPTSVDFVLAQVTGVFPTTQADIFC